MSDTQELPKPFCGLHRMLQALEWVKNGIYCAVGTASIWASADLNADFDFVNAQVAIAAVFFFNMYYYFNWHLDGSFRRKTFIWLSNAILSLWYAVGMGAVGLRLIMQVQREAANDHWGLAVLGELGLIVISYAIVQQLVQFIEGSVSYAITWIALRERDQRRQTKAKEAVVPNDMNGMLERLRRARHMQEAQQDFTDLTRAPNPDIQTDDRV